MTTTVFHRPARLYPDPPNTTELVFAAPPTKAPPQSKMMSVTQTIVPIFGSLGSLIFLFAFPTFPVILKVAMLAISFVSVISAAVMRIVQSRTEKQKRHRNAELYLAYLANEERGLCQVADAQTLWYNRMYPDSESLWYAAIQHQNLWERRFDDQDFCDIRIGTAVRPLSRPLHVERGNDPLSEYEPYLLEAAEGIVRRFKQIPNTPVTISLRQLPSIAIVGPSFARLAVIRSIIAQLVTFQGPTDLHLVIGMPDTMAKEWEPLKWLPHLQQETGAAIPYPRITSDPATFSRMLGEYVQPRAAKLQQRDVAGAKKQDDSLPHLVVIIDDYAPTSAFGKLAIVDEIIRNGAAMNVSIVVLTDRIENEPSNTSAHYLLHGSIASFDESKPNGMRLRNIVPDYTPAELMSLLARSLSSLRLDTTLNEKRALPTTIRLLDLLHIESPSSIDPANTWAPRGLEGTLRVPIGIKGDGDPLLIDLKEAAVGGMGPHGLVVGATGSGKSELLRSLITALAITHPPELVAFVFVDFKGGAAFADLAELPHVAGLITNLQDDSSRVDRMYDALVGEQQRRQQLLRMAGNVDGIKEYHAARDQDPSLPPMPYLFIVVDEFGELLAQRQDFLELFVTIGRIGRSIGMSLLFATQRLEEGRLHGLEGHLRYRICLRTFSAQESVAVLGTQDAYNLPSSPGNGYFKVDNQYNAFKAAIVTGSDILEKQAVKTRATVATYAGVARDSGGQKTASSPTVSTATTEMETAIEMLKERGTGLFIPPHQVWLPPLEPHITLKSVLPPKEHEDKLPPLSAVLGITDVPMRQLQQPLLLDFAGSNGHFAIVGAPQTGKSTFIRTLVASMSYLRSPKEVQFYCIDLGGGGLRTLEALPHVGTVCGKFDRETMMRLLREIELLLEEREFLFREAGVTNLREYQRKFPDSDENLADIFFIVDNWGQLRQEIEDMDLMIAPILTSGLGYGVHVILSSGRWNDIRSNLRDAISNRMELRLNEATESEIDRKVAARIPTGIPGRVLLPSKLLAQIALPRYGDSADDETAEEDWNALVTVVNQRWKGEQPARPVRLLPASLSVESLPSPDGTAGIPIGIEEARLDVQYLDFMTTTPHMMVLGDSECGKTNFLRLLMAMHMRRYDPEQCQFTIIDYRRTLLDIGEGPYVAGYLATANMAKEGVEHLKEELQKRLPPATVTRDQLLARSWWEGPEIFVIVDDYDLVATPSGNPIAPLADFVAQGRDVGLHIVLARRVAGISRSSFEQFFQRFRELGTPGLIMSGDPHEGVLIGNQKAQVLPPGRGFLVRRRDRTTLVQTAIIPPNK